MTPIHFVLEHLGYLLGEVPFKVGLLICIVAGIFCCPPPIAGL